MDREETIVRISTGLLAAMMLFGVTFADFARAATVAPTFMVAPRLLTPDTPRFQRFGDELPTCRKEKRQKRKTVPPEGDQAPCRRTD